MPHLVKNLCLQHKLTISREDYHSEDMLSDSDSQTPMLSDDLPPASESTDLDNDEGGDDTRNTKDSQDIAMEVLPPEESPPPL